MLEFIMLALMKEKSIMFTFICFKFFDRFNIIYSFIKKSKTFYYKYLIDNLINIDLIFFNFKMKELILFIYFLNK